jgi:hypothetical protein
VKIKYVTLTGADDRTSIDGLLDLSAEFPFVEWGILFSQSRQGGSRYPSWHWVEHLAIFTHLHLSAHLCGQWVNDAMQGRLTILAHESIEKAFGTIQMNCYKERLKQALVSPLLWRAISVIHNGYKPVILGGNYSGIAIDVEKFLNAGVYPLFDASGGHGQSPKVWPSPFTTEHGTPLFCGYAGGLGPDNVGRELTRINEVAGQSHIWIDMETKLRNTKDEFDLKKCRQVLLAVQQWRESQNG